MLEDSLLSGLAALSIAFTYLAYPDFERRAKAYQHLWIPVTGGIAVGYVFLYLLPKLGEFTAIIGDDSGPGWQRLFDQRVYFFGLLGFVLYYLVGQSIPRSNGRAPGAIWLHGIAFCLYALLVGDLLASMSGSGALVIVVTTCVFGLHLLGVNHQFRSRATRAFDGLFRWWFAAAVMLGWGLGVLYTPPQQLVMAVYAVLAGGMITNVMVEKLPDGDQSKLMPFIGGVILALGVAIALRLAS